MAHHRTDADDHLDAQLLGNGGGHLLGNLLQVPGVRPLGELLDEGDIGLIDGDDKVGLLIGEQILNHVDGSHIGGTQLAHQESRPGGLRYEVQLLGLGVDIPQKDIV